MNDAALVRARETACDLARVLERKRGRERTTPQQLRERLSFIEAHGDERLAHLIDRTDVRVIERRRRARLDQQTIISPCVVLGASA